MDEPQERLLTDSSVFTGLSNTDGEEKTDSVVGSLFRDRADSLSYTNTDPLQTTLTDEKGAGVEEVILEENVAPKDGQGDGSKIQNQAETQVKTGCCIIS